MTAFWMVPYVPDPDGIEVTALRDRDRSFIQRGPSGVIILPPEPHGIIHRPREPSPEVIPPVPAARRRGQCQGCGLDDEVDIRSRCRWCAELAALKARNLPGPRLNGWWLTVPGGLALALAMVLLYAVASVILAT